MADFFATQSFPRRLAGLSATLGRISSSARESTSPGIVAALLDEAKRMIEWTAADAASEVGAELVEMQTLIALWEGAWLKSSADRTQHIFPSVQAKGWSDRALAASGMV